MKVQFSYNRGGGPGVFMKRLKQYLINHYKISVTDNHPDIYISAVWRGNPPKNTKVVHRVDNCYFDTLYKNSTAYNSSIKNAIQRADGVVFQSQFSMKLCKGILGTRGKQHVIIYNGFDQSLCNDVVPFTHQYQYLFVSCACWRPIKRPYAIMEAFEKSNIQNSALIMIGDGVKSLNKNIICTGSIKSPEIYNYYKAATSIIHISRLESCPNAVVEGLSFGIPIVCNNAGGTPEIVGDDGIILPIDPPDIYKSFPMRNPDKVDIAIISDAMKKVIQSDWNIKRPDLDMSVCAKQYYDFFIKVLSK